MLFQLQVIIHNVQTMAEPLLKQHEKTVTILITYSTLRLPSGILGRQVLPLLASCLGKQVVPYVTQSISASIRIMTGVVFRWPL